MADSDATTIETAQDQSFPATNENFAELLEESLGEAARFQGEVVKGTVLAVDNDMVLIDVGLKSEGRVPLKEFQDAENKTDITAGQKVDVFVERFEDRDGVVILSRDKARREEAWKSALPVSSSAASRAVSPSICPALSRSCLAARSIFGRCVTSIR